MGPRRQTFRGLPDAPVQGPAQPMHRGASSPAKSQPELSKTGVKRTLDLAFLQARSDEIRPKNPEYVESNLPGILQMPVTFGEAHPHHFGKLGPQKNRGLSRGQLPTHTPLSSPVRNAGRLLNRAVGRTPLGTRISPEAVACRGHTPCTSRARVLL